MRHYKGFVYTPEPKTAWDNLSMREKAAMIKVAVSNGITNLQEIRDKYNEFAEGGHIYDGKTESTQQMITTGGTGYIPSIPNDFYKKTIKTGSRKIMEKVHQIGSGNWRLWEPFTFTGGNGPAQDSFLLNRGLQEEVFKEYGYQKGTPGDYGLVRKAVGNRKIPVYQTKPDATTRDKLVVLGNVDNHWFGSEDSNLELANNFPTALYTDGQGKFYQKAWDLNDYGGNSSTTQNYYNDLERVAAKLLDFVGSPTVITTGFQPIEQDEYNTGSQLEAVLKPMMFKKGLVPTDIEGKTMWTLPEINVYGNKHKEGGKIHIKDSKKGTFTAAATKHGMGVQEFASKVLANKDNYSPAMVKKANFARNSSKWHGLGGNLFDGESQPTQQMQIGREYWQSQANQPTFMEGLTEFNRQQKLKKEQQSKALRQQISSTGKGLFDEAVKSARTESNDNLWIDTPLTYKKAKNPHLAHRAEGAKSHAAWEEEHPVLNTVGIGLGIAPLTVAAYPFLTGAGETVAPILANPYIDAVATSAFTGHGLNHAINDGIDGLDDAAMTALEVAPLGRLINPAVHNMFSKNRLVVDNFSADNVRPLKGMDIHGAEYELPARTLRGGIVDANGNLISDAELVDNWKRSQDFYKMRLRNKGLAQQGHTFVLNKENAYITAKDMGEHVELPQFMQELDDLGGAYAVPDGANGYGIVTKELNTMGKQRRGTTNSGKVHEDSHLMRSEEELQNLEDINWSNLNLDKDEAAARGTQIKSMLGIKDNTPITAEQLKYMKDNFVRLTGMDNNMQAFLNSITDFDSAAGWLSKNSFSLGGAMNLLGILKRPSKKKGL